MYIEIPTVEEIINTNKQICMRARQTHICSDSGKIESVLHSAFYPNYGCEHSLLKHPFEHGGLATIAGALCYYLVKKHAFFDGNKRTALIASTTFLDANEYSLSYPLDHTKNINELATTIEKCAASEITKEKLMKWFDLHKYKKVNQPNNSK